MKEDGGGGGGGEGINGAGGEDAPLEQCSGPIGPRRRWRAGGPSSSFQTRTLRQLHLSTTPTESAGSAPAVGGDKHILGQEDRSKSRQAFRRAGIARASGASSSFTSGPHNRPRPIGSHVALRDPCGQGVLPLAAPRFRRGRQTDQHERPETLTCGADEGTPGREFAIFEFFAAGGIDADPGDLRLWDSFGMLPLGCR